MVGRAHPSPAPGCVAARPYRSHADQSLAFARKSSGRGGRPAMVSWAVAYGCARPGATVDRSIGASLQKSWRDAEERPASQTSVSQPFTYICCAVARRATRTPVEQHDPRRDAKKRERIPPVQTPSCALAESVPWLRG